MVTLLKLGGSLITDKTQRATLRPDVLARLASEIHNALKQEADMQLLIGHGSGSFGHFEAQKYGTMQAVNTQEQWQGFARVATIASELNFHVAKALQEAGVAVFRVQPSASAIARDGIIQEMAIEPILNALKYQLVPLVYGDVAFDMVRGGTIISTETVFTYLVSKLPVKRILLLGEVDGVHEQEKQVIPYISLDNFSEIKSSLGGSGGVDVTGGMLTKVQAMLDLANNPPYPDIFILNGLIPNRLYRALLGETVIGTRISR
jgi:isopentenyl phosphate kinase